LPKVFFTSRAVRHTALQLLLLQAKALRPEDHAITNTASTTPPSANTAQQYKGEY